MALKKDSGITQYAYFRIGSLLVLFSVFFGFNTESRRISAPPHALKYFLKVLDLYFYGKMVYINGNERNKNLSIVKLDNFPVFSRERSSTGSNDCFVIVVVVVLVLVGIFIL
jgi:hypothetical protein